MNERDIHGFPASPTQAITEFKGPSMATKKHSGILFKRIMSAMSKPNSRGRSKSNGHHKGIETNSKIHFGHKTKFY